MNQPFSRRLLSRAGTRLSRLLLGLDLTDATGGFCAYRRRALQSLRSTEFLSEGYFYQTEMKFLLRRFSHKEIPISYKYHSSHLRFSSVIYALALLFLFLMKRRGEKGRLSSRRSLRPSGSRSGIS